MQLWLNPSNLNASESPPYMNAAVVEPLKFECFRVAACAPLWLQVRPCGYLFTLCGCLCALVAAFVRPCGCLCALTGFLSSPSYPNLHAALPPTSECAYSIPTKYEFLSLLYPNILRLSPILVNLVIDLIIYFSAPHVELRARRNTFYVPRRRGCSKRKCKLC